MSKLRSGLLAVLCVALGAACANDDTHFDVRYASGFDRRVATVSIFGVFKNGSLSPEAWDEIGSNVSSSLGSHACDIAYGGSFTRSKPALATAVEEAAKANGISDPLLDAFTPLAKGDIIMTIVMSGGKLAKGDRDRDPAANPSSAPSGNGAQANAPSPNPQTSNPSAMRGRGGGGGSRGRRSQSSSSPDRVHAPSREMLELSAAIFSVRQRRAVGLITMTYSGTNFEEALDQFRQKLKREMPGTSCIGWNWDVALDGQAIRRAADEPASAEP